MNASPIWKGIHRSLPLLKKGICFSIGSTTPIYGVNPESQSFLHSFHLLYSPKLTETPKIQQVVDIINQTTKQWNTPLLNNYFDPYTANLIQQIHIPSIPTVDCISWIHNKSGKFTFKLAYLVDQNPRFLDSSPLSSFEWKLLWNQKIN